MNDIEALRLASAALKVRYVQLSQCRTCGVEKDRFEQAIERIESLISKAEGEQHDIQVQQAQSG